MKELKELESCPFCKTNAQIRLCKITYCQLHGAPLQDTKVGCYKCDLWFICPTEELAIKAWNTRAEPKGEIYKYHKDHEIHEGHCVTCYLNAKDVGDSQGF